MMVIGVCGFGYTGSSALYSLLAEFSNVVTYGSIKNDFEFNISYTPDGLEDLEYNLCLNPSKGVRGDIAVYRFLNYAKAYKKSFNRLTNGRFDLYTNVFINGLVSTKWKAYRTFEFERNPRRIFEWKVRGFFMTKFKKLGLNMYAYPKTTRYLSVFPNEFESKCREYISNLIFGEKKDVNTVVVLNQPFSANNPLNSMKFFPNPKCIFVDRDPRDLYAMLKHVYGIIGAFIPSNDVSSFIKYYREIRDNRLYKNSESVITIHFEDLVYRYQETIDMLKTFLGKDIGEHINKKSFFDPDISIKNTNVYKLYPEDKEDVELIEKELKDYLYDFKEIDSVENNKKELSKFNFM